jgi:hypothetical protein
LGIPNNNFKQILVQKFSKIKNIWCIGCLQSFEWKRNLGLWRKDKKTIDINQGEIPQKNSWVHTFWPKKRNGENLKELKVESFDEKLTRYESNWLRHVTRTNSNRMSKILLNYLSNWRRRLGRLWSRLKQVYEGLTSYGWWWWWWRRRRRRWW